MIGAVMVGSALLVFGADDKPVAFRPETELAESFVKRLESSSVAVYPAIVRTRAGTTRSEPAQKLAVEFMKEQKLGLPKPAEKPLNVKELKGKFQFDLFQSGMKDIGETVKNQSEADYAMALEFLVTPVPSGGLAVGGIHVYVLNSEGQNTFSFLLNSHHQPFVDADLKTKAAGDEDLAALVQRATKVALEALQTQLQAQVGKQGRHSSLSR